MHLSLTIPFNNTQTWQQRVLSADDIYKQVKDTLDAHGKEMPATLRRPDIRLILENNSGEELKFMNPGDHAKENVEIIPADGESKAVMIMLKGDSLDEQMANAQQLVEKFNLDEKGFTKEFAHALGHEQTQDLVAEAYGPAPFTGQSDKLVALNWEAGEGTDVCVEPIKGALCAYGARKADKETVFAASVEVFVKGTHTIAECAEGTAMCIALAQDWETQEVSTRPIVPSVAKEFYGAHYDDMPAVSVGADGNVREIDLKDGMPPLKVERPSINQYEMPNSGLSSGHMAFKF